MTNTRKSTGGTAPPVVTRRRAQQLARAKWGAKATITEDRTALVGEARAKAIADLAAHVAKKPLDPGIVAQPSDVEALRVWKAERNRLMALTHRRRCWIGHVVFGGLANMIAGAGDTWAEACTNAGLLPPVDQDTPRP